MSDRLPRFEPDPVWAWNGAGIEPSVPVCYIETAAWFGGFGLLLTLAVIWFFSGDHIVPYAHWLATVPGLIFALAPALVMAGLCAWLGSSPVMRIRHISGPRLREGPAGYRAAQAWSEGLLAAASDLTLAPDLPIPAEQWQRHALIFGGVGSGKTQILAHLVRQIDPRQRLLLADSKGDWTAALPTAGLLSPWDARSMVWDLARDVRTGPDAEAFAQAMIPDDARNAFWINGARTLLVAALRTLQGEHGAATWGWHDLQELLRLDAPAMRERFAIHHRPVTQILSASEQTLGTLLSSLAVSTRLVDVCADAWRDAAPNAVRWSVRGWLTRATPLPRRVIVQASVDQGASQTLLGLVLTLSARRMLDPAMPESPHRTLLWLVLDELAAAGRLPDLPALIERGRSKGIALIAGLQALEQLRVIYERDTADAIISMVGLHIVTQIGPGDTRERVAHGIGERRVAVPQQTHGADGKTSHALHETLRPLVLPAQLSQCLGPWRSRRQRGIRALVAPAGQDVFVLDWPIVPLTSHRAAHQPADWTRRPPAQQRPSVPVTPPPSAPQVSPPEVVIQFHDLV